MPDDVILDVRDLTLRFGGIRKDPDSGVLAVNRVSFALKAGETLSIVGESGSGKTTIGRCIARLYKPTAGQMMFRAASGTVDLAQLDRSGLKPVRQQIQMLFQDPNASLNSRMRIGEIVAEPLDIHGIGTRAEREAKVRELLARVGLGADAINRYPHQLSGGQRQRVGIARSLTISPRLLICDEPVSALDVSVQAAVTDLLMEIQRTRKTTLLFISHDLSIVRYLSDRIVVMYLGHIVESGTTDQVFAPPYHPYTEALLSAVPIADTRVQKQHIVLEGDIPSAMNPPPGCPFQTRCRWKSQVPGNLCETEVPPQKKLAEGHFAKCHLSDDQLARMEPVIRVAGE